LKKNTSYNIVFFIEFAPVEGLYTIHIDKLQFQKELFLSVYRIDKVHLQAVVVLNSITKPLLAQYIDFYKTHHSVDRFIIFDPSPPEDIIAINAIKRNDIVYVPFTTMRYFQHNDPTITRYTSFVTNENSAFSIALKKYDAEWTMFFDPRQFIKPSLNLAYVLKSLNPNLSAMSVRGYWVGCNTMSPNSINIDSISKRSNIECNKHLILRNSKNDFTICIHHPQYNSTTYNPSIEYIYVFSLKVDSTCQCNQFCTVDDKLTPMLPPVSTLLVK